MHNNKKLNRRQVIQICRRLNKGSKLKDIARDYDVSLMTISHIATQKYHTDITEKYLNARIDNRQGELHHLSKLTNEQVKKLRKLPKTKGFYKLQQTLIAEELNMASSSISDILSGKTYKNVK